MAIRRRFGQHFLTSPAILGRIADALEIHPGDRVIEIGPGKGALTEILLARGARLAVIEIDRDLCALIRSRFGTVDVHEADALSLEWPAVAGSEDYLVAGNIPYNITSPLLEKAFAQSPLPKRVVFTVQKEVADRVTAQPGTKAYGALTVGIAAQAEATRLFTVTPGAFHPPPRVESAVLLLVPREEPLISSKEVMAFRRFIAGLFGFRRKQIRRALRGVTGQSPEQVVGVLDQLGLDPTGRAEVLSPPVLVGLFRRVVDAGVREG